MAWSNSTPTTSTKIRNLPAILTANWIAIEQNDSGVVDGSLNQWAIHLIDRSTIGGDDTPVRLDNVGQLYCRNDGSLNELYFEDSKSPTSNKIQLTKDGKLGSDVTALQTSNIQFSTETATYASTNMVAFWGTITSAGAVVASSGGFTSAKTATGTYEITFSTAQSSGNYGVSGSVDTSADTTADRNITYYTKTTTSFFIKIKDVNGVDTDGPFTFIVLGERP